MFEPNPNRVRAEAREMWPGGPSRRWSKTRSPEATMPYGENGGYVGSYVCQGCEESTGGVYRVICRSQVARKWLCAACRSIEMSAPEKAAASEETGEVAA